MEEIDQLLLARRNLSKSRQSLRQSASELPYGRTALDAAADSLSQQIEELDRQIAQKVKDGHIEAAVRLQEVPGVGPVVAAAVAARLEAKQFDRADQFVAYCGLDLSIRDSGASMPCKRTCVCCFPVRTVIVSPS